VEPSTGAVKAIVGEYVTPDGRPIEIATGPGVGRQAGSAFKLFPLVAALEEGYTLSTRVSGAPAPTNKKKEWGVPAGQQFPSGCRGGTIDLTSATAQSNNCVFMRLQGAVGFDAVKSTAEKLGIGASLDPNGDRAACFAIGCGANVYPLDMAGAYGTIANDGRHNPVHFVQRVEDRNGKVLYEYTPPEEQVVSTDVARQATTALRRVVTGGTYKGGSLPQGRPAAGKTGTMEVGGGANTDVWFVGFTPQLSTAVWIGRPLDATRNLNGGRAQGGVTAAVVWRQFMSGALDGAPVVEFPAAPRSLRGKTFTDPWRSSSSSSSSRSSSGSTSRSSSSSRSTTTAPRPTTTRAPVTTAAPSPALEPEPEAPAAAPATP
jgi:penicillin-binding protein 1A